MRVLVDGDGCPVIGLIVEICKKYGIECILMVDTAHSVEKYGVSTITVSKGADSVDFALVNFMRENDVVITQDYGLAAMCLARRGVVLNQDGMVYDEGNIEGLLMARHEAKKVRNAGGRLKGNSKRKSSQNTSFQEKLTEILMKK